MKTIDDFLYDSKYETVSDGWDSTFTYDAVSQMIKDVREDAIRSAAEVIKGRNGTDSKAEALRKDREAILSLLKENV